MLVWLYPPVWRRLVSRLPMLVTALTLSLSLKTMMLQELKGWSVLRIFSKKATSGSKMDFRRAQKFVKRRYCLNEIEKSSWPRAQSCNPRNLHKMRQFELDNPPSLKAISWTARAFLWSKKGQGKQAYWATPTKVLLYFSVIYYMNTILVIIRIDQVRIFSIKFVIILKIIQNSRWVPWIWFDFSFCTLLAGFNNYETQFLQFF